MQIILRGALPPSGKRASATFPYNRAFRLFFFLLLPPFPLLLANGLARNWQRCRAIMIRKNRRARVSQNYAADADATLRGLCLAERSGATWRNPGEVARQMFFVRGSVLRSPAAVLPCTFRNYVCNEIARARPDAKRVGIKIIDAGRVLMRAVERRLPHFRSKRRIACIAFHRRSMEKRFQFNSDVNRTPRAKSSI